jgi:hypothetical protein
VLRLILILNMVYGGLVLKMTDEKERVFKLPARFTFKELKWVCIWMCVVYPLILFMGIMLLVKGGLSFVTVTVLSLFIFMGIAGLLSIFGFSDILIDNRGISRYLFGKIWQDIPWEDIRLIKTYPLTDYNTFKKTTAFNIFPSIGSSANSRWFNRIFFVEGAENMSVMLEIMNHYILKYHIEIESYMDGVKRTCTHL